MNERSIQNQIHNYFSGRIYEIPNVYLYDWESDFISVTRAGYIHEYEIKISKSDFNNDAKSKTHKHEVLQGGCRSLKKYEQSYIDQSIKYDCVEIPIRKSTSRTITDHMDRYENAVQLHEALKENGNNL